MIWNNLSKKWKAAHRPPLPLKYSPMPTTIRHSFPSQTKLTNNKMTPQNVPESQILDQSLKKISLCRNSLAIPYRLTDPQTVQEKGLQFKWDTKVKSPFRIVNRKCTFMNSINWSLWLMRWGDKTKNWKRSAKNLRKNASNLKIKFAKILV